MLQKVRTFTTAFHLSLLEFTIAEHLLLCIGLGTLSIVCLAWPHLMAALVQLVGLVALGATIYIAVILKDRQWVEGEEDDSEYSESHPS